MTTDLLQAALTAREGVMAEVWQADECGPDPDQFDAALDALCEAYRALGRAERRVCVACDRCQECEYTTHLCICEPATYGQGEGGR